MCENVSNASSDATSVEDNGIDGIDEILDRRTTQTRGSSNQSLHKLLQSMQQQMRNIVKKPQTQEHIIQEHE